MASSSAPRKPVDVSAAQKERNEYIPSFISKKPFYVADGSTDADYLEHQRLQKSAQDDDQRISHQKWYERGRKAGPAATKYRKGACENCGAMTHNTKDCLSRPRKHGAKWTGKDIQADEVLQDVNLGWDAKRDRWNGYDTAEFTNVIQEFNALEHLKKQLKSDPANKSGPSDNNQNNEDGEDDAKYEEETDMGRQQSTSTRNLRLREDTAKYLLNLDLDSAKYDPKTRSMVDSGATADQAAALVAEEGFMRASGDAAEFEKAQRYAWEMQERGDKNKVHLQANPTSGEYIRRKEQVEMEAKREAHKNMLLQKYGSQEHAQDNALSKIAVIESENFVEYDERGRIKGVSGLKIKSQYAEDIMMNNHTTVWGSWWKGFKWGYACCNSTVKNSYCTGSVGKRALEQSNMFQTTAQSEDISRDSPANEGADKEHNKNNAKDDMKSLISTQSRKRNLQEMNADAIELDSEEYRRERAASNNPISKHFRKDEFIS